jgi:hypothetical protein
MSASSKQPSANYNNQNQLLQKHQQLIQKHQQLINQNAQLHTQIEQVQQQNQQLQTQVEQLQKLVPKQKQMPIIPQKTEEEIQRIKEIKSLIKADYKNLFTPSEPKV